MIRMSRQADYGIVFLTRMARERAGTVLAASDVAAGTKLPLPTVSKILKALARGGLLLSHRGVKGGYSLARPPENVTIADVITALEGPIAMTDCIASPKGTCEHEPICQVRQNWRRINGVVMRALDDITLAEMTHPLAPAFVTVEVGAGHGA
jgi:FeS assembly SUF system regulator